MTDPSLSGSLQPSPLPEPPNRIYLGVAGWSIAAPYAPFFPAEGSHLQRYAARLPAVEVNTSFYRLHKPETYTHWKETTPPGFKFAVKVFRQITHEARLADPTLLDPFLEGVRLLEDKLGPLLVQLPPSLPFSPMLAERFFSGLRQRFDGLVACEPRHSSWFRPQAEALLAAHQVAGVAADPPLVRDAARPGGWDGFAYFRLHGSPETYISAYSQPDLQALGVKLAAQAQRTPLWCIFNNNAHSAALGNALELAALF